MCLLYHVYIVKYILLRLVVTLGWTVLYLLVATSYVFLAVDFVRPFGDSKSYSTAFIRYPFVPDCGFYMPF